MKVNGVLFLDWIDKEEDKNESMLEPDQSTGRIRRKQSAGVFMCRTKRLTSFEARCVYIDA